MKMRTFEILVFVALSVLTSCRKPSELDQPETAATHTKTSTESNSGQTASTEAEEFERLMRDAKLRLAEAGDIPLMSAPLPGDRESGIDKVLESMKLAGIWLAIPDQIGLGLGIWRTSPDDREKAVSLVNDAGFVERYPGIRFYLEDETTSHE